MQPKSKKILVLEYIDKVKEEYPCAESSGRQAELPVRHDVLADITVNAFT